jgi:hypothetical protein
MFENWKRKLVAMIPATTDVGVKTVRTKLSHCVDSLPRTLSVNVVIGKLSVSLNPYTV